MPTIIDGTAGITFPNSTVQASAGQVLQVVNATTSTATSTSTNAFVDTGLAATITPKFATSKILVLVSQNGIAKETNNTNCALRLLRGASVIANIDDALGFTNSTASSTISASICYLDSPATTSATVYKTQFSSRANLAIAVVQSNFAGGTTSTITLMEIAA